MPSHIRLGAVKWGMIMLVPVSYWLRWSIISMLQGCW